jgi:probable HAF family extracellular repeat protein
MSHRFEFAIRAALLALLSILPALLVSAPAWAQSSYTVQAIPAYNGNASTPRAINNTLRVAGDTNGLPFVWTVGDAAVTPLPTGLGAANPAAINNTGQIAGGAFLWTPTGAGYSQNRVADLPIAGTGTTLDGLGWTNVQATALNDGGGIVCSGVSPERDSNGVALYYACLLLPTGAGDYALTPIPSDGATIFTLNEDTRTFDPVTGAQTGGHAPQLTARLLNASGVWQWALWEWDGFGGQVKRWLDAPFNQGRGLNDRQEVVDWGSRGTINLPAPAYGLPAGNTALGTLGGNSSWSYGLNNVGQAVGSSTNKSGFGLAFIWTDGKIVDLNTRLSNPKNWTLTRAAGITDLPTRAQNYIIGNGTHRTSSVGFVLRPNP